MVLYIVRATRVVDYILLGIIPTAWVSDPLCPDPRRYLVVYLHCTNTHIYYKHAHCRQRFAQLGSLYELTHTHTHTHIYIYRYTQYITQDGLHSSVCIICPSDSTTAARQLCGYLALLNNIWNTLSSARGYYIIMSKIFEPSTGSWCTYSFSSTSNRMHAVYVFLASAEQPSSSFVLQIIIRFSAPQWIIWFFHHSTVYTCFIIDYIVYTSVRTASLIPQFTHRMIRL